MKDKEIWKDVKDTNGLYIVSNHGRIKSLKTNIYLKSSISKNRHPSVRVTIRYNRSNYKIAISRLVYQAFHGKLINNMVIDHIDNDPTNNYYKNLQQITHIENCRKDKWRYGKTSKYNDIYFDSNINKYRAQIRFKGIQLHIGVFNTEKIAYEAYNDVSLDISNIIKYRKRITRRLYNIINTK